MAISSRFALSLSFLMAEACGFPRPADVLDDAPPGHGSARLVVLVSTTGDDTNDGLTPASPVRTLKRAIGLAAVNDLVGTISLSAGRYTSETGESFPYFVPPGLLIAGPVGGGVILAGAGAEQGLLMDSGTLRDVEFEDFMVAVTGTGSSELTNIRVRSSMLALRGEASAKLTVNKLDVTGADGACATGIELNADANLDASNVSTRALGVSFRLMDRSTSLVARANIVGDDSCSPAQNTTGVFTVATEEAFELRDSIVDGGTNGVVFSSSAARTTATLVNTTIRNVVRTSIIGRKVTIVMTGGELSGGFSALDMRDSTGQITNVTFSQYQNAAIGVGDDAILKMRNCSLTGSVLGLYLYSNTATLDLGTIADPGGNIIQNQGTGLYMDPGVTRVHVEAVGNTWIPSIQGADGEGHYAPMKLEGPVAGSGRSNFDFQAGCSLQL